MADSTGALVRRAADAQRSLNSTHDAMYPGIKSFGGKDECCKDPGTRVRLLSFEGRVGPTGRFVLLLWRNILYLEQAGDQTGCAVHSSPEAAGTDLDRTLKLPVFLTDLAHIAQLNEVMSQYFKQPYPARSAVGVSQLPRGALVEIEAILSQS